MVDAPRFSIPGRNPDHLIVVGWDHPLGSFYYQLLHAADPDDEPIDWRGTKPNELGLEACLVLAADRADVPPDLGEKLQASKDQYGFDPDRPANRLRRPGWR